MKYRSKGVNILKYAIYTLIAFSAMASFLFFFFHKYPFESDLRGYSSSKFKYFSLPWPNAPLEAEIKNRNRLKRYSKSEVKRRVEKQYDSMKFLSTPIYDLSFDKNAEVITQSNLNYSDKTPVLWPVLGGNISYKVFPEESQKRKTSKVLFPYGSSVRMVEGLYLSSGEELKAFIPISKNRRHLIFSVLPLSPGNIRVSLGQFVWSKNFGVDDLNKVNKIVIPINDALATNYRLVNISSSFYMFGLKVVTISESARNSIQVSTNNKLWVPEKKQDKGPIIPKILGIEKDPLLESSNQVDLKGNIDLLAKGYNVFIIHLNNLNVDNFNALKENMPYLSNLLKTSQIAKSSFDDSANDDKLFRSFSLMKNDFDYDAYNVASLRDVIKDNYFLKIPEVFKKYGYKSISLSNSSAMFFPKITINDKDFDKINKSWLSENDYNFQVKNEEINSRFEESEGLDAIFKTEKKSVKNELDVNLPNFSRDILEVLGKNSVESSYFGYDENFIVNEENYTSQILDTYQKIISDNNQYRLFLNLKLSSSDFGHQVTNSDLFSAYIKLRSFNFNQILEAAQQYRIDRALKQLIETTRAYRIQHRTIFVLLLKNKKDGKLLAALKIPGLMPSKKEELKFSNVQDLVKYTFDIIGIPTEDIFKKKNTFLKDAITEVHDVDNPEEKAKFVRYDFVFMPSKKGCDDFYWETKNSSIVSFIGNKSFFRKIGHNKVHFFPCAFKDKVLKAQWFQKIGSEVDENSNPILKSIHGFFYLLDNKQDLPWFYFGPNFIDLKDLAFKELNGSNVNEIFYASNNKTKNILDDVEKTFQFLIDSNSTIDRSKAFLLLSDFHQ